MKKNMPRINRNFIFLGVAIVLGVLASLLAVHYVNKQVAERTQTSKPTEKTVRVVVPVRDLGKGTVLASDDLAARSVPADFVPADALTPANYQGYLGQVLAAPLTHGAPIPMSAVENLAEHFSSVIQPGDVAYTIQVNATSSISGLISPGDRIDLSLLTDSHNGAQLRPLLENILVLATGRRAQGVRNGGGNGGGYSNITLELTPKQAQRISVAGKVGALSVVLRHAGSDEPFHLKMFTKADLLRSGHARRGRGIQFIIGGKG